MYKMMERMIGMKFRIHIDETRTFRHQFVVEADSEEAIDSIIDSIESDGMIGINDYEFMLREKCKVQRTRHIGIGFIKEISLISKWQDFCNATDSMTNLVIFALFNVIQHCINT